MNPPPSASDHDPQPEAPPEMPEIGRRFHLRHLVGAALLAILPVVAAFGLLETQTDVERASSPALDIVVEYPTRVRASHRANLRILVVATTPGAGEGLTLAVHGGYLENFAVHGATPDRTAPGEVTLALDPGDTATVVFEMEAVRFGLHRGVVRVDSPDGDVLAVDIRTFILP